jgi:hypothetical protein
MKKELLGHCMGLMCGDLRGTPCGCRCNGCRAYKRREQAKEPPINLIWGPGNMQGGLVSMLRRRGRPVMYGSIRVFPNGLHESAVVMGGKVYSSKVLRKDPEEAKKAVVSLMRRRIRAAA